jgi:hypothetical protein
MITAGLFVASRAVCLTRPSFRLLSLSLLANLLNSLVSATFCLLSSSSLPAKGYLCFSSSSFAFLTASYRLASLPKSVSYGVNGWIKVLPIPLCNSVYSGQEAQPGDCYRVFVYVKGNNLSRRLPPRLHVEGEDGVPLIPSPLQNQRGRQLGLFAQDSPPVEPEPPMRLYPNLSPPAGERQRQPDGGYRAGSFLVAPAVFSESYRNPPNLGVGFVGAAVSLQREKRLAESLRLGS